MDESKLPPSSPTPEQALLSNLRNWTDLFPWLRLVKVCRIAGGPVWIIHSIAALTVWWWGLRALNVDMEAFKDPGSNRLLVAASSMNLIGIVWTWLFALPHLMAFGRVGALLTAGREIPSYLGTWKLVRRRIGGGALIMTLPLICSLPFIFTAWASAAIAGSITSLQPVTDWLSMLIIVPSVILIGLLVAGGKVAVPLGLVSLMTEAKPDAMDSLSRGYEYTLRRLPQLVGYTLVAIATTLPVLAGWALVFVTAWWAACLSGAGIDNVATALVMTGLAIATLLMSAMIGGVYLLLRRSAGGQEIADVWAEPEGRIAPKMPSVHKAT